MNIKKLTEEGRFSDFFSELYCIEMKLSLGGFTLILLIDNYDSFTYNLYQYIGEINPQILVKRNDEISVEDIEEINPSHIIISPGPGHPLDAGIIIEVIKKMKGKVPILGICLGHQAIGVAMGGKVSNAEEIVHGKQSTITNTGKNIFKGLPETFKVVRYHSLAIMPETLPASLEVEAYSESGIIMAISHKEYPIYGVQFHPESIQSEYGKEIIRNFLEMKLDEEALIEL